MTSLPKVLNPVRHYHFWRNYYERVREHVENVRYLRETNGSAEVIFEYLKPRAPTTYLESQRSFRELASSLRLSNDWFTANIPHWLAAFDNVRLVDRRNLGVLEIGSWEGLSSCFILHSLPNAVLTCVDTWEGADEHKAGDFATPDALSNIELAFDHNLSPFADRLIKYKGTSFSFFEQHLTSNAYDLIYVDGSHQCDDVLVDAIKCFEMLRVGGLMIFDDYLWRYYPRAADNPAAAINLFLTLKKGAYRIVRLYYQLIIQKTLDGHNGTGSSRTSELT
jgi:predicted O-methyltransferase YrrM